jgi:hypothetical protein
VPVLLKEIHFEEIMTRAPRTARSRSVTVGEVEDRLNNLYDRLSMALRNPPDNQLDNILSALDDVEWTLNKIIIDELHRDAAIVAGLSAMLTGATQKLAARRTTLQNLAQVVALGAALLNTIASVIPLL